MRYIDVRMNILILVAFVLVGDSLVGAKHDMAGKRSILENLVPGVNLAASGIGLTSGFIQASPQQIGVQAHHHVALPAPHQFAVQVPQHIAVPVPHPVAIPVPHPILVPVERPVPFAVDRPVPYPVPIIKKYFIPVSYKIPVPVPAPATHEVSGSENNNDLEGRSEITAESYRIYNNGARRDRDSLSSGDYGATTNVEASPALQTKSTKRRSSFLIRVSES